MRDNRRPRQGVAIIARHSKGEMLFLGYNRDREDAKILAARFRSVGVDVWCSASEDNGRSGDTYHKDVFAAIKRADCFLVLLGEHGLDGELLDEVQRALTERGKRGRTRPYRIVPFALPSARRDAAGLLEGPAEEVELIEPFLPPVWLPGDWRQCDSAYFLHLAETRLGQKLGAAAPSLASRTATLDEPSGASGSSAQTRHEPLDSAQPPRVVPLPNPESRGDSDPGGGSALAAAADADVHRQRKLEAQPKRLKRLVTWTTVGIVAFAVGGWLMVLRGSRGTNPLANGGSEPEPLVWSSDCPSCVAVWNYLTIREALAEPFAISAAAKFQLPAHSGADAAEVNHRFGEALHDDLLRHGWRVRVAQPVDVVRTALADAICAKDATPFSISSLVCQRYELFGSSPVPITLSTSTAPDVAKEWSDSRPECTVVWSFLLSRGETTATFDSAGTIAFDKLRYWTFAPGTVIDANARVMATGLDSYITDGNFGTRMAGVSLEDASARLAAHFLRPTNTPTTLAEVVSELYELAAQPEATRPSSTTKLPSIAISTSIDGTKGPNSSTAGILPLQMVRIRGDKFRMGDGDSGFGDEKPEHVVDVKGFELSAFEVTRGQWRQVMGASAAPKEWNEPDDDRLPANYVNWFDAVEFCNALSLGEKLHACYTRTGETVVLDSKANGYRLPSEAEWEYACRADRHPRSAYSFGDEESKLVDYGWFFINSGNSLLPMSTTWDLDKLENWGCRVHAVGEKRPSEWKLYDMHGNVWEWCTDWYHESYDGAPTTGVPWIEPASEGRVIRGGSFGRAAVLARSAFRFGYHPSFRWNYLGFRPARSVTTD